MTRLSLRRMNWLLPHPAPPLPSARCLSFSVFLCALPVELTDGRVGGKGVGEGPNHTVWRRESLSIYKSFNTICTHPFTLGFASTPRFSESNCTLFSIFVSYSPPFLSSFHNSPPPIQHTFIFSLSVLHSPLPLPVHQHSFLIFPLSLLSSLLILSLYIPISNSLSFSSSSLSCFLCTLSPLILPHCKFVPGQYKILESILDIGHWKCLGPSGTFKKSK
jgi:hypothetical protein